MNPDGAHCMFAQFPQHVQINGSTQAQLLVPRKCCRHMRGGLLQGEGGGHRVKDPWGLCKAAIGGNTQDASSPLSPSKPLHSVIRNAFQETEKQNACCLCPRGKQISHFFPPSARISHDSDTTFPHYRQGAHASGAAPRHPQEFSLRSWGR